MFETLKAKATAQVTAEMVIPLLKSMGIDIDVKQFMALLQFITVADERLKRIEQKLDTVIAAIPEEPDFDAITNSHGSGLAVGKDLKIEVVSQGKQLTVSAEGKYGESKQS
jgi:hypothetical protein